MSDDRLVEVERLHFINNSRYRGVMRSTGLEDFIIRRYSADTVRPHARVWLSKDGKFLLIEVKA